MSVERRTGQDRRIPTPRVTLLDPAPFPTEHKDDYLLLINGQPIWITPEMLDEGFHLFSAAIQSKMWDEETMEQELFG